eukprot:3277013-Pyramimonas_sp.AAC.1
MRGSATGNSLRRSSARAPCNRYASMLFALRRSYWNRLSPMSYGAGFHLDIEDIPRARRLAPSFDRRRA